MKPVNFAFVALIAGALTLPSLAFANVDDEIAKLERENAELKKNLRLEALKRENSELRKQLNVEPRRQEASQEVVRSGPRNSANATAGRLNAEERNAYAYADIKDGPYYKAPPPIMRPMWEGLSVGFHAGMGFGNWSSTVTAFDTAQTGRYRISPDNSDGLGALAGLQIGYLWQTGAFVFGPEADLSVSSIKDNGERNSAYSSSSFSYTQTNENFVELNWLSSVRGKLGVASGNWLFFGSGGLALAGFEASRFFGTNVTDVAVGYAFGGGISHAFNPNVSLRLEYLRYAFSDIDLRFTSSTFTSVTTVNPSTNVVRAGLDWRFN